MNAAPNIPPEGIKPDLRQRAASTRDSAQRVLQQRTLKERFDCGREYSASFDFGPFSIEDLSRMYELARSADEWWGALGNMPLCEGTGGYSPIGWFVEFEEQRMSFLRDHCVREIASRVPADDDERDTVLRIRFMHELECNGRIHSDTEPGLLIKALKAWG